MYAPAWDRRSAINEHQLERYLAIVNRWLLSHQGAESTGEECLMPAGTNSIAAIELLFDLEEEFGVEFPPETVDASLFASGVHLHGVLSDIISDHESTRQVESTPEES